MDNKIKNKSADTASEKSQIQLKYCHQNLVP